MKLHNVSLALAVLLTAASAGVILRGGGGGDGERGGGGERAGGEQGGERTGGQRRRVSPRAADEQAASAAGEPTPGQRGWSHNRSPTHGSWCVPCAFGRHRSCQSQRRNGQWRRGGSSDGRQSVAEYHQSRRGGQCPGRRRPAAYLVLPRQHHRQSQQLGVFRQPRRLRQRLYRQCQLQSLRQLWPGIWLRRVRWLRRIRPGLRRRRIPAIPGRPRPGLWLGRRNGWRRRWLRWLWRIRLAMADTAEVTPRRGSPTANPSQPIRWQKTRTKYRPILRQASAPTTSRWANRIFARANTRRQSALSAMPWSTSPTTPA